MTDKSYTFKAIDSTGAYRNAVIDYDGYLTIEGFDYEYEKSMVEFGEWKSECLTAAEHWANGKPEKVMVEVALDPFMLTRITIDWAKHTVTELLQLLDQYEFGVEEIKFGVAGTVEPAETYGDIFRVALRLCEDSIKYAQEHRAMKESGPRKKYVALATAINGYKDYLSRASIINYLERIHRGCTYAVIGVYALLELSRIAVDARHFYAMDNRLIAEKIEKVAEYCRKLAHAVKKRNARIPEELEEERVWQIRRFIDIIDAVRSYKDYPGLAETL